MRIIGYTFAAAAYCPTCTAAAYDAGDLDVNRNAWRDMKVGTDEHGLPDALTDSEGNDVGIITDCDEGTHTCDDCGEGLE